MVIQRLTHRLNLLSVPTPVRRLVATEKSWGKTSLWAKLDGVGHSSFGGTKLRNLEYLIADALSLNCESITVHGLREANFPFVAAEVATRLGLKTRIYLATSTKSWGQHESQKIEIVSSNNVTVSNVSKVELAFRSYLSYAYPSHTRGKSVNYSIPIGGASPVGCLGGVSAALELAKQVSDGECPMPNTIFLPLGSGGTLAGMIAGAAIAGLSNIRWVAVVTGRPISPTFIQRLSDHAFRLATQHCSSITAVQKPRFILLRGFENGRFGRTTAEITDMIGHFYELERLRLDHLYSVKCMMALKALALPSDKTLVWLTNPIGP